MTEISKARVDAIFAEALERPATERAGYLDEMCAGDAGLRAEVDELLRLSSQPFEVLEAGRPASAALFKELFRELGGEPGIEAGQRVGRWRLVRELGRGGMGTVYLAERADGEFEQTVALKLLGSAVGSAAELQRFEQERQILASLEHPNIARLIDGGRAGDGRPFIAMEYVVGRRIDAYCTEQRLGIEQRVDLVIRVAKAVQSAHRRLIVHRDLKPSNILVTGNGTPKLLDFGIAKLLEPVAGFEPLTRTLTPVLTPEYASPEQVRCQPITTASDVYQLGLLLYELLTGERAQRLEGSPTPAAIERAVCDTDTPRPSRTLARAATGSRGSAVVAPPRALRGDLDNIVLRALHKEPERRYGSAAELVADLENYRRGFPVAARPDSVGYRTGKFVRRHRFGVAVAALVAALGVGYAVTATVQQRKIREEAVRARQAADFVTRIFRDLARGEIGSGQASALEVIDEGAQQATTALTDQPDLQAEILTGFGDLYLQIGHYDRALPGLELALDIRSRRLDPGDPRIGETALLLGRNLHYAGRLRDAEEPLRRARDSYHAAYGPGDSRACLARAHLGDLLHTRGDLPAAQVELQAAVDQCGGGLALRDLANVLRDRGDLEAALAAYPAALEKIDDERQRGLTYLYWGYALTLDGDLDRAAWAFERTREIDAMEYGGDHPVYAMELRFRGRLALARGDTAAADRLADESLAMNRRWLGDDHHQVPRLIVDRAAAALAMGRPEAALEGARDALSRYDAMGIPDHPMALEARLIAGAALLATGDLEGAIGRLGQAVARQEALFTPFDPHLAASYALLAEALERAGDRAAATGLRARARAAFERRPHAAILSCRTYGAAVRDLVPGGCGP